MAVYTIEDTTLTAIADAIREKTGGTDVIKPIEMANAIDGMDTIPDEAFILTGTGYNRFGYNVWNWFIEGYGDKITTRDLSSIDYMFRDSNELTVIPFDINMKIAGSLSSPVTNIGTYCFDGCNNLTTLPNIYITTSNTSGSSFYFGNNFTIASYPHIFWDDNIVCKGFSYNCFSGYKDSKEPIWLFEKLNWEELQNYNHSVFGGLVPTRWAQARAVKEIAYFPQFFSAVETQSYYHHWFQFSIADCHNLKTITLPRPGPAVLTSSPTGFSQFNNLFTLKHLTFDVQEDGTPYTAEWKNITININRFALDGGMSSTEQSYMDKTKKVNSAEAYEALKNDDEYWVVSPQYSGYNHDSAVETINSLPDTSAYLATAGGTNTIKFYSGMGSATDGGAISNLTEEEIAVATAKGWTVSLV